MSDLGFDNMQRWRVGATYLLLADGETVYCDVDMSFDTPLSIDPLTLKQDLLRHFQDVEVQRLYTFREV